MKILVCISKVPDTTAKISFTDNNTKFNEDKVQFIINPYDEWYALVRALELKEANGGTVTVINAGLADNEQLSEKHWHWVQMMPYALICNRKMPIKLQRKSLRP